MLTKAERQKLIAKSERGERISLGKAIAEVRGDSSAFGELAVLGESAAAHAGTTVAKGITAVSKSRPDLVQAHRGERNGDRSPVSKVQFNDVLQEQANSQAASQLHGLIDALVTTVNSNLTGGPDSASVETRRKSILNGLDAFVDAAKKIVPEAVSKATDGASGVAGSAYQKLSAMAERHAAANGIPFSKAMSYVSKTPQGIALTAKHRAEQATAQAKPASHDPVAERDAVAKSRREEVEGAKTVPYRELEKMAEDRAARTGESFSKALTAVSKTPTGQRLTAAHRDQR